MKYYRINESVGLFVVILAPVTAIAVAWALWSGSSFLVAISTGCASSLAIFHAFVLPFFVTDRVFDRRKEDADILMEGMRGASRTERLEGVVVLAQALRQSIGHEATMEVLTGDQPTDLCPARIRRR